YEVLGKVGSGGMGIVLRAWDDRLHREVAIKIVRDGYRVPGARERFLQEARSASRLNHPNICTIFDLGEKDGDPYLVMELLEGVTVGTVSYMSPEQARGNSIDPRSDLFSLGVVMYEMATRRTPFKGTNSSQVFVQILEHDPEPVRNWNDSIPRELERIIEKLL